MKSDGFVLYKRAYAPTRPVDERRRDFAEVYVPQTPAVLREQGARCMDCGIPFCHQACPLGNVIPDWNDLAYRDHWQLAKDRLLATNNFPEFTGRLCPAPCEAACVLALNSEAVTIKNIEQGVIDRAFAEGWMTPQRPALRTGKKVAVVGSGPAGLAAAEQLNRAGHLVTVFERDDRAGGLLRYGIPDFKLEKNILQRRLQLMEQEGITFCCNAHIGPGIPTQSLQRDFDAVLLACGAAQPRDLDVCGRQLQGIHFAMDYLRQQNKRCAGDAVDAAELITAFDKQVIIIGGGDTGADCLGTVHRQGARQVRQLDYMPAPPQARAAHNPWPQWPMILRQTPAHEEGGERMYALSTQSFVGAHGHVQALHAQEVREIRIDGVLQRQICQDKTVILPADLILLAIGFAGPEPHGLMRDLNLRLTERGNVWRDAAWMTSVPGVFTAGDMQRGQSLIVWAIAEGRSAARGIDAYLMGQSRLPAPLD